MIRHVRSRRGIRDTVSVGRRGCSSSLHPSHPSVVLGGPFGGRGFKFSVLIGNVLADLAVYGHTRYPIDRFRPGRFTSGAAHAGVR